MQKFLKENNIRFRVIRNPDIKAAVVECFNRTLKERMWRYFTHKNTRRIDVLQDIVFLQSYATFVHQNAANDCDERKRAAHVNIAHRWNNNMKHGWKTKYYVADLVRVSRA